MIDASKISYVNEGQFTDDGLRIAFDNTIDAVEKYIIHKMKHISTRKTFRISFFCIKYIFINLKSIFSQYTVLLFYMP